MQTVVMTMYCTCCSNSQSKTIKKQLRRKRNGHVSTLVYVEILAYGMGYRMKFDRKLKVLSGQTQSPVTEKYQNFADTIKGATENHVSKMERQKQDNWITEEIRDLFEERRKNQDNETRYCELENLIKQICIQTHEEFLKRKCAEIEQLFNLNSKVAHMKIREISDKKTYNTPSGCLKDKNGEMLFEE